MKIRTKADLEKMKEKGLKSLYPKTTKISVGMATCGLSTGAGRVYETIQNEVEKAKLPILLGQTGCIGFCQREPVVDIFEPGKPRVFYQGVTPERSMELVQKWLDNKVVEDLLLCKMEREDWIVEGRLRIILSVISQGNRWNASLPPGPFLQQTVKDCPAELWFHQSRSYRRVYRQGRILFPL